MELNEDFRACSVFPTYAEIVGVAKAPLQKNIVDGKFESIDHYLETQFWLLREQIVAPLRRKVNHLKRDTKSAEAPPHWSANFHRPTVKRERLKGVRLSYSEKSETISGEKSQCLKIGSLVCFTCNSFETLLFAKISYRDDQLAKKSQVFVEFVGKCKEDIFKNEYLMFESDTFFAAYEPVLRALQHAEHESFPFPQYFVHVSKEDNLPRYMRNSNLTINVSAEQGGSTPVRLLDPSSWPPAADLGLDASQLAILQSALTRELAFVTGPPGSGKTYTAVKLVEMLAANRYCFNLKRPILVISNTNHSLDKFLLQLVDSACLVRVGFQSKFRQLNDFNYNKLEGSWFERLAYQEVIGMTASKAAEWGPKLNKLGCEIVVVEDASVLFDGQLFACLSKACQHLILIGGEKQLRPKLEGPDLAGFNLEVSFFERMLRNRKRQENLQVQHRMPPEMTGLISPLIYPEMKHASSGLPALQLLAKRVSFVTHNYAETPEEIEVQTTDENEKHTKKWKTGNSKKNEKEASFVVALCKYLVMHKLEPQDVTILTTYLGQSNLIRKLMKEEKSDVAGLLKVEVATVDNFQGGENKFVILSLVRSNAIGALGFLEEENRIGAALSKAQNALVMVGDMSTLSSKNRVWQSIKQGLYELDALSGSLQLRCMAYSTGKHSVSFDELEDFELKCSEGRCTDPQKTVAKPTTSPAIDAFRVRVGPTWPQLTRVVLPGSSDRQVKLAVAVAAPKAPTNHDSYARQLTSKPCGRRKSCGHVCRVVCPPEEDHSRHNEVCREWCLRWCDAGLHQCILKCFMPCAPCSQVRTVTLSCGRHTKSIICMNANRLTPCEAPCRRLLRCNHLCSKKCHEPRPCDATCSSLLCKFVRLFS